MGIDWAGWSLLGGDTISFFCERVRETRREREKFRGISYYVDGPWPASAVALQFIPFRCPD
jgi:hypothetical protein